MVTNLIRVPAQGRTDEAWCIPKKLLETEEVSGLADQGSVTFPQEDFQQMRGQISHDVAAAASETLWTLFTKPSYRRRMLVAFIMFLGAESTGILVIYSKINQCLVLEVMGLPKTDLLTNAMNHQTIVSSSIEAWVSRAVFRSY